LSLVVFVPHSIIYFLCYEKLKLFCESALYPSHLPSQGIQVLPFYAYAACGALSGAVAGGLSNPLDLIKTRWQAASTEETTSTQNGKMRSLKLFTKTMYRAEGLKGFGKGTLARMLYYIPSTAVSMAFFETLKNI
jgi:hypothetical protein